MEGPGGYQAMPSPGKGSTIAERLHYLTSLRPEEKGGYWTDAELAAAIERRGLGRISGQTIWRVRTGQTEDPRVGTLAILAEFFGVKPSYFTDDDPAAALVEIRLALGRRDGGMRSTLLRSLHELSDDGVGTVSDLVDKLLAAEKKHRPRTDGNGASAELPADQ